MEVRKATCIKPPAYPDKSAVLDDLYLLKTLPERWKRNAAVCVTLAVTTSMMLSGCGDDKKVRVFDYGRGICSTGFTVEVRGMVAINPIPIVLEEDEAFRIIYEEAKKQGIDFMLNKTLENVQIPVGEFDNKNYSVYKDTSEGNLALDGSTQDGSIAFEYVSADDADEWMSSTSKPVSKGDDPTLDMRAAARALAESLQDNTGETVVGVFYDPIRADRETLEGKKIEDAKEMSEQEVEDLRAQVRDFIAWLKAQGII